MYNFTLLCIMLCTILHCKCIILQEQALESFVSLTPLPYSVQPPLSFLQYQIHSVVRMKWGGLVTEDAVDSRRISDTPQVIDIKSTT